MKRAKDILIFLALVVSMLYCTSKVFPADEEGLLDAEVFIEQIFTIMSDATSIDFGSIDPAADIATPTEKLKLYCATNNNNPWEVSLVFTSSLSSDLFTIPDENFRWRGTCTGAGGWSSGGPPGSPLSPEGSGNLTTAPLIVYYSGMGEYIAPAPVEFTFEFNIDIPENQAAGTYSTTVIFSMKDTVTLEEVITAPIDITVEITPRLIMSVSPTSLDFGKLEPGTKTATKYLKISCATNNNNPWSVSLYALSELTAGVYIIPSENFHWSLGQTGYGGTIETGYGRIMSLDPYTFYTSSIDQYVTAEPVNLNLTLNVDVPSKQAAGNYRTTLVLTMTEDGAM